jgi:nucleotide-binding universal stress UspA family protein
MFRQILVPLDGSRLAESALPAAVYLAGTVKASVTLFHVMEHGAPQEIHGERHLTAPEEAAVYLAEVAARAFPRGMDVPQHVHTAEVNDVARSISEHAVELGSELIVMCTHGRGGVRGWMFGSVAQQVAGLGTTPILLVHPDTGSSARPYSCRRLLVPLDGNPDHEEGVPVAAELAKACGAELRLVMAVHRFDTLSGEQAAAAKILPRATHALLDLKAQEAKEYLSRHVTALRSAGFAVKGEVRRGDPPTVIVEVAERAQADLIVLGTHGKTGMDAFWSGSATPDVARRSTISLLLVPVRGR